MSTHVVVPVRDQLTLTSSLCDQLRGETFERCWVFDNGSTDGTADYVRQLSGRDPRFRLIPAAGRGIYEMWTSGVIVARLQHRDAVNVAILNNDLFLAPGTIGHLADALRSDPGLWAVYPDYDRPLAAGVKLDGLGYTAGTYRHGGLSGFCFMVAGERLNWSPLIDPTFHWWGGDDDLAFEIESRGGKQARVRGLPVEHLCEGTAVHHDLHAQKAADLAAVVAKWGR